MRAVKARPARPFPQVLLLSPRPPYLSARRTSRINTTISTFRSFDFLPRNRYLSADERVRCPKRHDMIVIDNMSYLT